MPGPRLDEALDAIVAAAAARCEAGRAAGGLLEDLTAVVRGERARARPAPPYLWVTAAGGDASHAHALAETWTVDLVLSVFVQSEDPEDGWMRAIRDATRARSLVIAERRLGLPYVVDVQSRSVRPIGQQTGRRFGAFARLAVITTIREPQEP